MNDTTDLIIPPSSSWFVLSICNLAGWKLAKLGWEGQNWPSLLSHCIRFDFSFVWRGISKLTFHIVIVSNLDTLGKCYLNNRLQA